MKKKKTELKFCNVIGEGTETSNKHRVFFMTALKLEYLNLNVRLYISCKISIMFNQGTL